MEDGMKILAPTGVIEVMIPPEAKVLPANKPHHWFLEIGAEKREIVIARNGLEIWIASGGRTFRFSLPEFSERSAGKEIRAPMTGKIVDVPVGVGEKVQKGDTLVILEAMKMEYRMEAPVEGEIQDLYVKEGDLVDLGQVLIRLV